MRAPYTKLQAHLVWATWDRLPFIEPELESELSRVLGGKARELRCQLLACGGDYDHVHCLVRFTPTISIATLVGEMKGTSSHWINHVWRPNSTFKWQGAYGAFSLSPNAIPAVEAYVRGQRQHHAGKNLWEDWEQCTIPDDDTVSKPGG